jgi:hypothetical protein
MQVAASHKNRIMRQSVWIDARRRNPHFYSSPHAEYSGRVISRDPDVIKLARDSSADQRRADDAQPPSSD